MERRKRQASLWAENIEDLIRERDDLFSAARAWADAIVAQEIAAIERCEGELIAAIARCEQKGDRS